MRKRIYRGIGRWCLKHDLLASTLITLIMGLSVGGMITVLENMLA